MLKTHAKKLADLVQADRKKPIAYSEKFSSAPVSYNCLTWASEKLKQAYPNMEPNDLLKDKVKSELAPTL